MKNHTFRLMYQTAFCTLSVVAFAASLGLFRYDYYDNWYIFFTNLSNYFCMGVMAAELVETVRKKDAVCSTVVPKLKFIGLIMILLTACVFNFVLAHAADRNPADNYAISSVLLHLVLPVMYIADWFMFYERKKVKWYYPLISVAAPLVYAVFVFVRAPFVTLDPSNPDIKKYPYFFVDVDTLGWGGVAKWMLMLLVGFVAVGYLLMLLDRISVGKKSE